ncbi:hypothetical protein KKF29_03345, partial [Patescibacteria group bacterium]|nr:hypothetical protein [Patescibacteria group bacterium]
MYLHSPRKNQRLNNRDYSKNGYYFITICTKYFVPFFGDVKNKKMILNSNGEITEQIWKNIPNHFENVYLDEFIIMPNHVHGIIIINRKNQYSRVGDATLNKENAEIINSRVGDADLRPLTPPKPRPLTQHSNYKTNRINMQIPKIIHQFKSTCSRTINSKQNRKIFFQ